MLGDGTNKGFDLSASRYDAANLSSDQELRTLKK